MNAATPREKSTSRLHDVIHNPGFKASLESLWDPEAGAYRDFDSSGLASAGIQQYLLIIHTYLALGRCGEAEKERHVAKAGGIALYLASRITDEGLILEPSGVVSDHPANACHVADGLGTFCYYSVREGWGQEMVVTAAREALLRIVEKHYYVRSPHGVSGRTQQMRFETRAYYWAWRLTDDARHRDTFMELWNNGAHVYRNRAAMHGGLIQPSLHPDFTWNYACSSGTTIEYATNSHTPVYYCTEPQGFVYVYMHGLRDGVLERNPEWDAFCRDFLLGLFRSLSRAGHTASDVDGYGIHRAWYSGCLVETIPVEAAGAAAMLGLPDEVVGWFQWYVERYADFVSRSDGYAETGLPTMCPYGHNITIEKQFPKLIASRFYMHLIRGVFEFGLAEGKAIEPPAMLSYAWWHNWVRVSTRFYETSFVGTTSLCRVPVVKNYGDPNLGCIHGGSPLSTLFSGDRLMYATSNNPAGLWHVELVDVEGNLLRSSGTSFEDETSMSLKASDGRLLSRDQFVDYETPCNLEIKNAPSVVSWAKNIRGNGVRFFVQNSYSEDEIGMEWGASFPAGNYIRRAAFLLPIPVGQNAEIQVDGQWCPLVAAQSRSGWPSGLRWSQGETRVDISLNEGRTQLKGHGFEVVALPTGLGNPGGENSFCPYPLFQVRLSLEVHVMLSRIELKSDVSFKLPAHR